MKIERVYEKSHTCVGRLAAGGAADSRPSTRPEIKDIFEKNSTKEVELRFELLDDVDFGDLRI